MPNWCTNLLTIYGDKKEIQRFLNDPFLDFNRIAPMPEELLEIISPVSSVDEENKKKSDKAIDKYGFPSWYEWRIKNWGTKWDVGKFNEDGEFVSYDDNVYVKEIEDNFIRVSFDTAWGPSLPITEKLSIIFPDLLFYHAYEETGMDFAGYFVYKNGKEIESELLPHSFSTMNNLFEPDSYIIETEYKDN